jgi:hypothetical protein
MAAKVEGSNFPMVVVLGQTTFRIKSIQNNGHPKKGIFKTKNRH